MKTTIMAFTLLLAAPVLAQEEDDHATTSSGHDPKADRAGTVRMTEADTPAGVQSTNKTFGVGFGQTVGGVRGVEVEYYLGNIMLNGHLGFLFFAPDNDNVDSSTYFAIAAGGFYRWRVWDNVAVMLGARLDIGHTGGGGSSVDAKPQVYQITGSATQFNIELPLRAQIYFADMLAVHAEVGPVLAIIGEGGGVLGESWAGVSQGVYLDLPATSLVATFGVIAYFE